MSALSQGSGSGQSESVRQTLVYVGRDSAIYRGLLSTDFTKDQRVVFFSSFGEAATFIAACSTPKNGQEAPGLVAHFSWRDDHESFFNYFINQPKSTQDLLRSVAVVTSVHPEACKGSKALDLPYMHKDRFLSFILSFGRSKAAS